MADLQQSVAALQSAVTDVANRVNALTGPLQDALAEAQAALQTERDAAAALAQAEDAEDVAQNQELADARAATDAAMANASSAADEINAQVDALNQVAQQPPAQ